MSTVLVFRDGPPGPSPLRQDLTALGHRVVAEIEGPALLLQAVAEHTPELVVGEVVGGASEALFAATQALAEASPCPVLLFTNDPEPASAARAVASGVHGWAVDAYGAEHLPPLLALARARFERESALLAELQAVSERLEERKVVERAKGILMRAREVSDDGAFEILRTASMHSNQRLGQVSQQIIHSAHQADAVNRAGQLRMLSQRLVKLHLLRLADPKSHQYEALLTESVQRVDGNLAWLAKGVSQPDFGDLLGLLSATWVALKSALAKRGGADQLPVVDALADRLLEDAERLTGGLQSAGSVPSLQVLNVAGRQRMLSQRFAKWGLMALLNIEPAAPNTGGAPTGGQPLVLLQAEIERAQAYLNGLPLSTPVIRALLDETATGWRQLVAATPLGSRPAGRDRVARLESVAQASEALLDGFDRLSTQYERSMQMLMG